MANLKSNLVGWLFTTIFSLTVAVLPLISAAASAGASAGANAEATDGQYAGLNLPELQKHLASQLLIRGQFEQSRKMEMFNQALISNGSFVINKNGNNHQPTGLIWQQNTPFPVTLVLTDDKLSQQVTGQPAQVMTAKDNPMAFYFSHIFLSLFNGQTDQLNKSFQLQFSARQQELEQWLLILTPTQPPLDTVFSTIEVRGRDYIEQIELTEKRGDSTTIRLSHHTEQPSSLTEDERQQLQL